MGSTLSLDITSKTAASLLLRNTTAASPKLEVVLDKGTSAVPLVLGQPVAVAAGKLLTIRKAE